MTDPFEAYEKQIAELKERLRVVVMVTVTLAERIALLSDVVDLAVKYAHHVRARFPMDWTRTDLEAHNSLLASAEEALKNAAEATVASARIVTATADTTKE